MSALVQAAPFGPARADDAEDRVVTSVERLGGKVGRDEKAPGRPVNAVHLHGTRVIDVDQSLAGCSRIGGDASFSQTAGIWRIKN